MDFVMWLRLKLIYCKINLYFIRFLVWHDMTGVEIIIKCWRLWGFLNNSYYMILSWEISQWAWEQGKEPEINISSTSLPPRYPYPLLPPQFMLLSFWSPNNWSSKKCPNSPGKFWAEYLQSRQISYRASLSPIILQEKLLFIKTKSSSILWGPELK